MEKCCCTCNFCFGDDEEYLTCSLDNEPKEFDDVCDEWEFDCEML